MRGIARAPYGVRAPPLPVCTAMSTLAAENTGEATLVQECARLREHIDAQLYARPKHTVLEFMQLDLVLRDNGHALGRDRARWQFPIDYVVMDLARPGCLGNVAHVPPLWAIAADAPSRVTSLDVIDELDASYPFLGALGLCPSVQIAGGSVCRAILGTLRRTSNERYRTCDIDVFFGNMGDAEATAALQSRVESTRLVHRGGARLQRAARPVHDAVHDSHGRAA